MAVSATLLAGKARESVGVSMPLTLPVDYLEVQLLQSLQPSYLLPLGLSEISQPGEGPMVRAQ